MLCYAPLWYGGTVLRNPPALVQTTLEAVCIMLGSKTTWKDAKALMSQMDFIDKLKNYDKDNIPPKIMKRIRNEYIPNADFTPERIAKASSACEGMCRWICAMEIYDRVAKVVAPKKAALQVADSEYTEGMRKLELKLAAPKVVVDKLSDMQAKLKSLAERKAELETKYDDTNAKLERAEKLMAGLGGEQAAPCQPGWHMHTP